MFFALLFIVIIILEISRRKKNGVYDVLTGVNIYFAVYFGLSPFLFNVIEIRNYISNYSLGQILVKFYSSNISVLNSYVIITTSYIFIIIGYYLFSTKKYKTNTFTYQNSVMNNRVYFAGIVALSISLFSLLFHTINMGGVVASIRLAEVYRSISSDLNNDLLILRFFQPLILSSFFCFLVVWKSKRTLNVYVFITITFILSIYYLTITASRYQFLLFIITILLFLIKKIKVVHFIMVAITVIFGFIYGDSAINYIIGNYTFEEAFVNHSNEMMINISKFIQQTIFPFINTVLVEDFVNRFSNYRLFGDLIYPFINLVPGSILALFGVAKINQLWVINTINYESFSSGVPVDLVTFGFYQLGLLGVIITSFLFGVFVRNLNIILSRYQNDMTDLLKIQSIFVVGSVIINADPEVFIRGNINFIFLIVVFLISNNKKARERQKNESEVIS